LGQILGYLFAPVAWLIGVPWHDCMAIGNLLGTRMALNEVIAYIALGAEKATLAPRSFTIATFALCGFANLGSIGMQIGASGRWYRNGATTWPSWACARCWRERWRT